MAVLNPGATGGGGLTEAEARTVAEEVAAAREPAPSLMGEVFITTAGNDANSGASKGKAKATFNAAREVLHEGTQALNATGYTPRNGIINIAYGLYKVKSKRLESNEAHNETKGGRVILDPKAVALGVVPGMFCFCMDEWKNFPEWSIVEKVEGEKVTLRDVETKWGVKTIGEGGTNHTISYVEPWGVTLPGIKVVGCGKHGGVGLKASTSGGTILEDEGNGVTLICAPGNGEKGKSFVGMELRGLWFRGIGKECTTSEATAQSHGEREGKGSNLGTLFGFTCYSIAEVRVIDCQFSEHEYVGCQIGAYSTVTLHVEDCFFNSNGVFDNTYTAVPTIKYGGLWLVESPNQGTLVNNRYNGNFGVGLITEGGVSFVNDEHSHNFLLKNVRSGGTSEGVGLLYESNSSNGLLAGLYGWGEGNDKYEMVIAGCAVIQGYTFRGATSGTHAGKSNPTAARVSGFATFVACQFGASGESYWKVTSPAASDKVWILEPNGATGRIILEGCECAAINSISAEGEEKGIRNNGYCETAYSRKAMSVGRLEIGSGIAGMPVSANEGIALTAGTAFHNTTGSQLELTFGVEHTGSSELEILRGETEAKLVKIHPVIKMPTTGTVTDHRIFLPHGWWCKVNCVSKCSIVGPTGVANRVYQTNLS